MTDAPTESPAAEPAAPLERPRPARPARRRPTDLTFELPDDVRALGSALGEHAWLQADREIARAAFLSLPVESNQLYTPYIDLRAADLADIVAYGAPAFEPAADARTDVPPDVDGIIEFTEDRITALALSPAAREAGVALEAAGSALRREPDLVRALIDGGGDLPEDDKLAQLTRAAWNQGPVLRVPDGVVLQRPIVIRWILGRPRRALFARTLISLGRGARASVVEELVAAEGLPFGGGQALYGGTTEVFLETGADLSVASVQELGPDQIAFQHRASSIGDGANLRLALAQLGGRLVRSRVDNRLVGDRSSVEQVEIVFGAGSQLFDLTSYTRHIGRDTTGDLLSKGALLDASRSYMKGLITIERSARGTDSFLGEFGMNLSKQARAVAIPSLEIDQPDCRRAMHSSSVGPIDEGQLFYLESRGIPPEDARKFIVLGFLEPVVARVPLEAVRERLRDLLDEKWVAGTAGAAAA